MILSPCPREKELRQRLALGQWPQAAPLELRAHLSACRSCAELALVTETFQRARAAAAVSASLSSPGALWWRAQLRRRQAAAERIAKPILGAQIFALVVILTVMAAVLVSQARHGLGWLNSLEQLSQTGAFHLEMLYSTTLFNSGWSPIVLIPALATLALFSGVAVYLAAAK
jgi:hypothetical protein